MSLPSEVIILDGRSPCLAIKRLRNELQKGPCSFYWPYLKTLHEIEISLPAVWSLEDLALLDGLPTPKGGFLAMLRFYKFLVRLELAALEAGKATLSNTSRIAWRVLPSRNDSWCFVILALRIREHTSSIESFIRKSRQPCHHSTQMFTHTAIA